MSIIIRVFVHKAAEPHLRKAKIRFARTSGGFVLLARATPAKWATLLAALPSQLATVRTAVQRALAGLREPGISAEVMQEASDRMVIAQNHQTPPHAHPYAWRCGAACKSDFARESARSVMRSHLAALKRYDAAKGAA